MFKSFPHSTSVSHHYFCPPPPEYWLFQWTLAGSLYLIYPLVSWPASITDLKPSVLSSNPRHVGKRTKNHRDHTSALILVKDSFVLLTFNWLWLKARALCFSSRISSSVSMNDKFRPLWSRDFFFFLIWQSWWINKHVKTQCIACMFLISWFIYTHFFLC